MADGVCNDATHTCAAGTPVPDDTACPSGGPTNYCLAGVCTSPVCGNGKPEPGEECDDGNAVDGDGCDAGCRFSCLSTDPARGCPSSDECVAAGVCNDTTHTCAAGAPAPDNQACSGGPNNYCLAGVCTTPVCGNTRTEPGEECDDGNATNGDGCDTGCTFSCLSTDPARGCPSSDECVAAGTCSDTTHTCAAGPAVPDGQLCSGGPYNYCSAGVCTVPVCGNLATEPGEDCDGGPGCLSNCTFLCTDDPATQCQGTLLACERFVCAADHSCTTGPDTSQDGAACDPSGDVCVSGRCVPLPSCGDGTLDAGEQCDDGNRVNLDGCDSVCQFEEDQRIISLQQQFGTDDICPQNALGLAITADAQPLIQPTWDGTVANGSLSVVFKFLGLQDLTGADSPFTLGFVNSSAAGRVLADAPVCGNGVCEDNADPMLAEAVSTCPDDCTYDGTNDLDWWCVRDVASVDNAEIPRVQLSGQISKGMLSAGPGTITLNLPFALQPTTVKLFDVKVTAAVDGEVNTPTVSTTGSTPGHLASEHLDPALKTVSGSTTGAMCSRVSAASLFNTPIPVLLLNICTRVDLTPIFTPSNTLLDVFISGCDVFGLPAVVPTQPDGGTDRARYRFGVSADLAVTSCTRNGDPALLADCLGAATFSSYFQFASDRVIIRRN